MIEKCCICSDKVKTKKILRFRDLIGSGVELFYDSKSVALDEQRGLCAD